MGRAIRDHGYLIDVVILDEAIIRNHGQVHQRHR